ncbi:MAG: TetR/AcrR family transcriptional regulator [Rhizobiaceae bacterium]|nr:TetR/AcrR family transcriptional regulator [Rhizobiaceae bacterium]
MARTAGSIGTETAKRVLKEALSLFAHHGYAAVSTRQIAAACGLQVGALYNHFPTKQAILHALMATHLRELLEAVSNARLSNEPSAALEDFTRFHIRYHIGKPEEVFIAYMELRNLEPEPYAEVMKLRQEYERTLRGILREGQARDVFQIEDVPVTAMSIISMMTGVNTWFRYGGRLSATEIEEIYVNLVLSVVGLRKPATVQLEEIA